MGGGDGIGIPKCHVVAVPYPGRGHVNPMLNICKLLSSKGILITFVVTEEWLGLIGLGPATHPNIRFRTIPNVIPSENVRGADFAGFVEAVYTKMEEPFDRLLERLEPPVSCIVADTYLPWAVAVGNHRSIPVASLWTMSPCLFAVFRHLQLLVSNGHFSVDDFSGGGGGGGEEAIDYIPGKKSMRLDELQSYFSSKALLGRILEAQSWASKAQFLVLTSFYELESLVTDSLRTQLSFPVYTIGPSIPYMSLNDDYNESADYYNWLDSQPKSSVLYISLGSFLSVSEAQMDEIANGLCASGVRFLWVVRGSVSHMQELSGEMGLVVPWCNQLRVLCHSSVGGFLTHCGFNSTLESIYAGVPMLTFPIIADQFPNRRLIVDDLEVGLSLKARSRLRVERLVRREEIASIVQRLMELDGEETKKIRRRAKQIQEICRRALDEGGSSYTNLNAFIAHISDQ